MCPAAALARHADTSSGSARKMAAKCATRMNHAPLSPSDSKLACSVFSRSKASFKHEKKSLEFLVGRALANNITNLVLDPIWSESLRTAIIIGDRAGVGM